LVTTSTAQAQVPILPEPFFAYNATLEHDQLYEVCPYDFVAAECSNSYMENDALSNAPSEELKSATKGWMGKLAPGLKLNQISIPGTHDSGAITPDSRVGVATQTWSIAEQLDGGIRFFDIRIHESSDSAHWDIYHGSYNLDLTFGQVLSAAEEFLTAPGNGGETVILRIQTAETGVNEHFSAVLTKYKSDHPTLLEINHTPTLGDVRGKIVLVNSVNTDELENMKFKYQNDAYTGSYSVWLIDSDCYGRDCADSYLAYEGDGDNFATLTGKQRVIREQIEQAAANIAAGRWVLNTLNGAFGATPAYVASFCNQKAFEALNKINSKTPVGTIWMDYPGEGLIYRIIKTNFDYSKRLDLNMEVDCYDGIIGEHTFDQVTANFYRGTELLDSKTIIPGCSGLGDSFFNITAIVPALPAPVTHVEMSTDGGDAFAMDRLWLKQTQFAQDPFQPNDGWDAGKADIEMFEWGSQGGMAFCLSTDSGDNFGSYAPSCVSCFRFEVTSGLVYSCDSVTPLMSRITAYRAAGTSASRQSYSVAGEIPPPDARCKDITVALDGAGEASILGSQIDNGSFVAGDPHAVLASIPSMDHFTCADVGEHSVTLTVYNSTKFSTCVSKVTVVDALAPQITCPASFSQTNDPGICGGAVTYTAPIGRDNCPGATTRRTAGLSSGATYPVGRTTNTFEVTDASANNAGCTFSVTVVDNEAPVISLKPNIVDQVNNHKYRPFTITELVASVSDNCTALRPDDCVISQVTSDEPDDAPTGDGNTKGDIMIAPDCKSVQLMQERDGLLDGRVYQITETVKDNAGNVAQAASKVSIPLSSNGVSAIESVVAQTINGCRP
jgi:hypothetical protein